MLSEDQLVFIINQLFDAEKKCGDKQEFISVLRNLRRINSMLTEDHVAIYSPLGESYNETRTDCEATIMEGGQNRAMTIQEVLKPMVADKQTKRIIQKAVVLVA